MLAVLKPATGKVNVVAVMVAMRPKAGRRMRKRTKVAYVFMQKSLAASKNNSKLYEKLMPQHVHLYVCMYDNNKKRCFTAFK